MTKYATIGKWLYIVSAIFLYSSGTCYQIIIPAFSLLANSEAAEDNSGEIYLYYTLSSLDVTVPQKWEIPVQIGVQNLQSKISNIKDLVEILQSTKYPIP